MTKMPKILMPIKFTVVKTGRVYNGYWSGVSFVIEDNTTDYKGQIIKDVYKWKK